MRSLLYAGLAVALLAAGLYGWRIANQAGVAAAAMAKVACSCVFVDGRDIESCRADDPPGFEQIAVELDPSAGTATASAFGLITRRADHTQDYGCILEP